MKLILDSLLPQELSLIRRDLEFRQSRPSLWQDSRLVWAPELREGFTGSVALCPVSGIVLNLLTHAINRHWPVRRSDRLSAHYQVWGCDSGINPHGDERYRWAATVYLNDYWPWEWGGLLLAAPEPVRPLTGSMAINTGQELHAVSRIREGSDPRVTVQIFCL